jgi:hypothetical protein
MYCVQESDSSDLKKKAQRYDTYVPIGIDTYVFCKTGNRVPVPGMACHECFQSFLVPGTSTDPYWERFKLVGGIPKFPEDEG